MATSGVVNLITKLQWNVVFKKVKKKKNMVLYSAVSSPLDRSKRFTLYTVFSDGDAALRTNSEGQSTYGSSSIVGVLRHTKYLKTALHSTNVSFGTIVV